MAEVAAPPAQQKEISAATGGASQPAATEASAAAVEPPTATGNGGAAPAAPTEAATVDPYQQDAAVEVPAPGPTDGPPAAQAEAPPTAGNAAAPTALALPPAKKKILVVGDETLLFSAGIQEAYPEVEFTAATALSRHNLEAYNIDPIPQVMGGRVGYMVDPCRVGKHFQQHSFDSLLLFLPGLSFMVPKELGTPDRPLFAYRTHLFVFHILRHAKLVLKGEGQVHLVWPDAVNLMSAPCGAAGIEMPKLVEFCGCEPQERHFDMSKIGANCFRPFLFGELALPQAVIPEWLTGTEVLTFRYDRSPIAIPLSVALLLHPDVGFVCIKEVGEESNASSTAAGIGVQLRTCLVKEAAKLKDKLKEIYRPKENPEQETPDVSGLVPNPADGNTLLSIPKEIFMVSFDDVPHLSALLKFQICDEQPHVSIASLDVLDPRLPTRIARPPPAPARAATNPFLAVMNALAPNLNLNVLKKRKSPALEEWGGMKFYCPLTKICTMSADRMRMHMEGDLYKRMAAETSSWNDSAERRELLQDLEEAEALEEQQKRAKMVLNAAASAAIGLGKGAKGGKGDKGGKGGKGKSKGNKGSNNSKDNGSDRSRRDNN